MGTTRQVVVKSPRAAAPRGSARARMPTPRPPRRRGRAHELAKRAHQRGPGRAQLGAMSERQAQQQPVPARGEPHQDPAAVARAARAAHQPVRLHAIDQLDGAVMPDAEPRGEDADRRLGAAGQAAQREQELVLLGLEPARARHGSAEGEEAPQRVAELGQRPVLRQRDVAGGHRRPIYIVSRYELPAGPPGGAACRPRAASVHSEASHPNATRPVFYQPPAGAAPRSWASSSSLRSVWGPPWQAHWPRARPFTSPYPKEDSPPAPDGAEYDGQDLASLVARELRSFRPNVVVIPHPYDVHLDHAHTSYFVIDALDALQAAHVLPERLLVLTYLVHHHTWPSAGSDRDRLAPPSVKETPDTLWSGIDLTPAELAAKAAALDEYRTQLPVLGDLLHRFCRQNELYGRVKSRVLDGIAQVH